MRGRREPEVSMLAFIDPETRVPLEHPLRTIKAVSDQALARLSPEFDCRYAAVPARATSEGVGAHRPLLCSQRAGLL